MMVRGAGMPPQCRASQARASGDGSLGLFRHAASVFMLDRVGPADHVLAIDQGTTSTRAILFDADARAVATARRELEQHYPARGWVEHDPEQIWRDTLAVVGEVLGQIDARRVASIGITNQRETIVVWDRATGQPIHRAIVWQDPRTAGECARPKTQGAHPLVPANTGPQP